MSTRVAFPALGVRERIAAAFDPRDLPGLEAWYDAKYVNGFGGAIPADGTFLSQWVDLSGKGRHLIQNAATQQPAYRAARAAGAVVNLAPNPRANGSVNGWATNNSIYGSATLDTTTGHHFSTSVKQTRTVTSPSNVIGSVYCGTTSAGSYAIPVTPGLAYHIQIAVKSDKSVGFKAAATISGWNSTAGTVTTAAAAAPANSMFGNAGAPAGSYILASTAYPAAAVAANTWQIIDLITPYMPAGIDLQRILISVNIETGDNSNTVGGENCWYTEALVEPWPSLGQYVDGDMAGGYGWSGTAEQSSTVRVGADTARVQFDGLNDWMSTAAALAVSNPGPVSIYFASTIRSDNQSIASVATFFNSPGAASQTELAQLPKPTVQWDFVTSGYTSLYGGTPYTYGAPCVLSAWGDGVTGGSLRTNGAAAVTSNTVGHSGLWDVSYLGNAGSGSSTAMDAQALLLFSRKHDLATERRIINWLARRYGATLTRP